tara:strand:+ start:183 stop:452 length:270 start_codon:yes stop_codon:yes gene_type:complete
MRRITVGQLETLVRRLNESKKYKPVRKVGRYKNGKFKSDKGFHLSSAYGGYKLVYSDKDESSQSSVTSGYAPKRELFDQINAMLMYKRF